MNYVKSCLIITMLLGVQIGYSQDCDPNAETGWNCDCNEDTWQEYYPNMVGCYLEGADLQSADLWIADLSQAHLGRAILAGANLAGANLAGANLALATFTGADLPGANLTDTYCWGTFFLGTILSEANFTNAICMGAFFGGANLVGAIFDGADLNGAYIDMTGFDDCENWNFSCADGYDDASFDAGSQTGDVNLDRELNILDLVASANMILEGE